MKPKSKPDTTPTPKSVTIGDVPPSDTMTKADKTGWEMKASVILSNGKSIEAIHKADGQPDTETVNAFHRRSIDSFRSHLPENVTFDNSAVVVSTNKLQ